MQLLIGEEITNLFYVDLSVHFLQGSGVQE